MSAPSYLLKEDGDFLLLDAIGETGLNTDGDLPTVSINSVWTNPDRVFAADNSRATADDDSDHQEYSFGDFGLPDGAIIKGIRIVVEGGGQSGGETLSISLSPDGGSSWTAADSQSYIALVGSDNTIIYGSSTDLWGRTWTLAEFAAGTFQLRGIMDNNGETIFLDSITVTVYYDQAVEPAGKIILDTPIPQGFASMKSRGQSYALGMGEGDSGVGPMRSKQQTHASPMDEGDSGVGPMRSKAQNNPLPMEDESIL